MRKLLKKFIPESLVLRAILIFFLAYVPLVILWIQVKGPYEYLITFVASKGVAGVKDAKLENIMSEGNGVRTWFKYRGEGKRGRAIVAQSKVSINTSNVPLTLSLLASLSLFLTRRARACAEALLMLLFLHLLYVFSFEMLQLTTVFMTAGIEEVGQIRISLYQFLSGLTDYASMSFAPFLILIYVFMRFRRP